MGEGGARYAATLPFAAIIAALFFSTPAHAAGGPDIVDDAYAEDPRVCHAESWLTGSLAGGSGSLEHIGLGCTSKAVPRLEIDAAVEHATGGGATDWSFQPGVKYTLLARPGAFAIGLSAAALIDRHGRMEGVAINLPISVVRGRYTIFNVDIGWQTTRGLHPFDHQDATWGVQIEQAVAPHLIAIGEVFGVGAHGLGGQAGLRWSPGPQRVDIDLRAARAPDGVGETATLGIAVRICEAAASVDIDGTPLAVAGVRTARV